MSVVAKPLDGLMPLGREVGLDPSNIVLDGANGAQQPPFRPMSVVATVAHLSYC